MFSIKNKVILSVTISFFAAGAAFAAGSTISTQPPTPKPVACAVGCNVIDPPPTANPGKTAKGAPAKTFITSTAFHGPVPPVAVPREAAKAEELSLK